MSRIFTGPAPTHVPLVGSGLRIFDTPKTLSHVSWNGTALVDSYGLGWAMSGTVPQTSISPFVPTEPGAGVYSTSNYYSLPQVNPLSTALAAGNFTMAMVLNPTLDLDGRTPISNGGYSAGGFYIQIVSHVVYFVQSTSGDITEVADVAHPLTLNGPNLIVVGFDGVNNWLSVNGNTPVTAAGTQQAPGDQPFVIGAYPGGGAISQPFPGIIHEVWISSDTPTVALLNSIAGRVFGMLSAENQPIVPVTSFARASVSSNVVGGQLYYWPPNVARIDESGLLVEPGSVNLLLDSAALADGTDWTTAHTVAAAPTMTAAAAAAPDGTTTAASMAIPAVTALGKSILLQGFTATAAIYTASVWIKGSTTSTVYLSLFDGTTTFYTVTCAVTTSWQRFVITSPVNLTAATWYVNIGVDPLLDAAQSAQGAQTIYVWGAQVEALLTATSYIPTTSVAVTRAGDGAGIPSYLLSGVQGSMSVDMASSVAWLNADFPGAFTTDSAGGTGAVMLLRQGTSLYVFAQGGVLVCTGTVPAADGLVHHYGLSWQQVGSGVLLSAYFDRALVASGTWASSSVTVAVPYIGCGYAGPADGGEVANGHIKNFVCAKDAVAGL